MTRFWTYLATAYAILCATAHATKTTIDVRAISHDGKFIGSSMGGVRVMLKDADSGELLADGVIIGSTGDTDRLMKQPRTRGRALSTSDSAVFRAVIDIDAPRRVELTVFGPMAQQQSASRISATRWVLPGKDITAGDGWMVEMPGLSVDVLEPTVSSRAKAGDEALISANVVLMCGCPFMPDGLWDANALDVSATVSREGKAVKSFTLKPAATASRFEGRFLFNESGIYEIAVTAHDPASGNSGVDFTTIVVE